MTFTAPRDGNYAFYWETKDGTCCTMHAWLKSGEKWYFPAGFQAPFGGHFLG